MDLFNSSRNSGAFEVTRTIPVHDAQPEKLQQLANTLQAIESIAEVRVDDGRLHLRYDASSVGFQDIERLFNEAGLQRPTSLWWRCRSAWYRFLDTNAKSNALSKGGACCSRPPSPWRGGDTPDS
jgi:NADP-dependent 3-hydroxy acid dehydrogenase YdfG